MSSTRLKVVGPFRHSFLSLDMHHSTTQSKGWLNPRMQKLRYGGPTVKLHLDLQLNPGVGSANLHIVQRSKTVIGWGFNVGASQMVLVVKNPPAQTGDIRDRIDPWMGKIPWSRKWQPTPVVLPGESHGERSLVGFDLHVHTRTSTHAHTHIHTRTHTLTTAPFRRGKNQFISSNQFFETCF